jgi:hypothetical protein
MLGTLEREPLVMLGNESVTTPAGTFATTHFRAGEHAHFYLMGADAILVRFVWDSETIQTEFVLTSLETGTQ